MCWGFFSSSFVKQIANTPSIFVQLFVRKSSRKSRCREQKTPEVHLLDQIEAIVNSRQRSRLRSVEHAFVNGLIRGLFLLF